MKRLNKILIMLLGRGLSALVSFLMMPYLARSLTKVEYANYGQCILVIITIVGLLAALFNKSLYVFLANEEKDDNLVVTGNLLTAFILSLIGSVVIYLFADQIAQWFANTEIAIYLRIYCWVCPIVVPYYAINALLIYHDRVKQSMWLAVCSNVLKLGLMFVSIQVYQSLDMLFMVMTAVPIVQLIIGLLLTRGLWRPGVKGSLSSGIEQLRIGLPLGITGVFGLLISQMDGLMISKLLGQVAYADYRNGAWQVPFVATLYASISSILLPEVAKLWAAEEKKEIVRLKSMVIVNTALVVFPLLVFILLNSETIILSMFSDMYAASWTVFAVFNLTLILRINDYSDILVSSSNTRLISRYYLIGLLANLALNFILIDLIGIVGAALASFISILLLAVLQARKTTTLLESSMSQLFEPFQLLKILGMCLGIFAVIHIGVSLTGLADMLKLGLSAVLFFAAVGISYVKLHMIHPAIMNRVKSKLGINM